MDEFFQAFIRNGDGSWRCVAPATLEIATVKRLQTTPGSVFVPGRRFMNVDVVALLEQYEIASSLRAGD